MKVKMKHFIELVCGDGDIPKKIKRRIIGHLPNRRRLRSMLDSLVITRMPYPQTAELSDEFCPKCGCRVFRGVNHGVPYPEIWTTSICCKCGFEVGGADNSPFVWAVEDEDEFPNITRVDSQEYLDDLVQKKEFWDNYNNRTPVGGTP